MTHKSGAVGTGIAHGIALFRFWDACKRNVRTRAKPLHLPGLPSSYGAAIAFYIRCRRALRTSPQRDARDLTDWQPIALSSSLMPYTKYPWRVFWVLLFASIGGVVGVLPYLFSLFGKLLDLDNLTMPLPVFAAVQVMHSSIAFGMVIVLGLLLAPKVGIELPLLGEWLYHRRAPALASLRVPAVAGFVVGVATMLLLIYVFLPGLPGWPSEAALPAWKRLLACVYGGINEELLMRLFVFGVVLWLLQKIARREARASTALFWTANVIVALLFGAAYLPAASKLIELTPFAIFAIIFLKGAAGLVFGYLCWVRGLEAAMIAHFSADFVLHMITPLLFDVPVTS